MSVRHQNRSGGAVFFLFLLGVLLTLGLYFVKTWVQSAKAETEALRVELGSEQEIVSVLRSELAHLQSPARVEALARERLGLDAIAIEGVISVSEVGGRFSLKETSTQRDVP